jgi:aminocarboxymuconate-semialdehyde decarboxylase
MNGPEDSGLLHRCDDHVRLTIDQTPRGRLAARTIDMHCHIFVPEAQRMIADSPALTADAADTLITFGAASVAVNADQLKTIGPKLTNIADRLADMDTMGVDVQVISVSPTQYHYLLDDAGLAESFVARVNDRILDVCATHPERFVGLGTVSLQFPDRAAVQLETLMREHGLRGIEISTHVDGLNISDRSFDPFWQKADELGAIVFVHPWGTTIGERLNSSYLGNIVGQPMETAIALSGLIFEGTLDRHPGVKIVAAHGGGYLPLYINRSDHGFANRTDCRGCANPPSSYLKRVWFDSLVYKPDQLARLIEQVGASQVVLGTDYPFDMGHYHPASLLSELDPKIASAIAGGNAAALLGLKVRGPTKGGETQPEAGNSLI